MKLPFLLMMSSYCGVTAGVLHTSALILHSDLLGGNSG